jgi:hypothetical protein
MQLVGATRSLVKHYSLSQPGLVERTGLDQLAKKKKKKKKKKIDITCAVGSRDEEQS